MTSPLIHCLTNAVTAPFVADCIAAVGGRPLMAEAPEECTHLGEAADGLCVNLGQLTNTKRAAILASVQRRGPRPWVLDPVGVGFFADRLDFAHQLLTYGPTCLRGNASEIWALATGGQSGSGIDSNLTTPVDWAEQTQALNAKEICLTQAAKGPGPRDLSLVNGRATWFGGGRALMGQLSGFGCALSAVTATLEAQALGAEARRVDALRVEVRRADARRANAQRVDGLETQSVGAGAQALDLFSKAGQATQATGFGEFRQEFLNHLAHLARRARALRSLPLYFVAGPQDCDDLPAVLAGALAGGITCFQYRPKTKSWDQMVALGTILRAQCGQAGVPFIVNDSVELAQTLTADGVHLGQSDGDPLAARRILGSQALIGQSISQGDHWTAFDPAVVDYVGLGPFAATQTKPDARSALGLAGLKALRAGFESIPAVAIGGIDAANMAVARSGGVHGIAVVSAISRAPDPQATAQALILSHS